jgi:hypothetical protein
VRSVMGNYLEQSLKLFGGQSVSRGPQG